MRLWGSGLRERGEALCGQRLCCGGGGACVGLWGRGAALDGRAFREEGIVIGRRCADERCGALFAFGGGEGGHPDSFLVVVPFLLVA